MNLLQEYLSELNEIRSSGSAVKETSYYPAISNLLNGVGNASMGDRYGRQLVEDIEYRQEQVKKAGLGFELPPRLFGLRGLQIVENVAAA